MNAKQAARAARKLAEKEAAEALLKAQYPVYFFTEQMTQMIEDHEEEKAAASYIENWNLIRGEIQKQVAQNQGKPIRIDDFQIHVPNGNIRMQQGAEVDFSNLIAGGDIEMVLMNTQKYAELKSFAESILSLFDLSDDHYTYDNFRCAIGEALNGMGLKKERDEYYSSLLSGERNDYVAAHYAEHLLMDKDITAAENFMKDYLDTSDDIMLDRFRWLEELKSDMQK